MAFQENLNSSIDLFFFFFYSFFRSPGSDVSHGPGCLVGFLQGYAWCSLSLCHFVELGDITPLVFCFLLC